MSRTTLTDAQKWILGGIAAVVALLIVVVAFLATGDDGEDEATATSTTTSSTTTTEATTTTSTAETTTTMTFVPPVDAYDVAFPSPEASRSFEEPEAATRAYAIDVLGFDELVLGPASATGEDTAEVVIQDREDGPETIVALQEAEGGAWYVLSSETEDIVVSEPAPGTSLATPFRTSGEAVAFEGNVEVLVLTQGESRELGTGTVTGAGSPPPEPFEADIAFSAPEEATPGVLVYRTRSPEDGRVVQATSFPVRLTTLRSDG